MKLIDESIAKMELFLDFSSHAIFPEFNDGESIKYIDENCVNSLIGNALGMNPHIPVNQSQPNQNVDEPYNPRVFERMESYEEEERIMASMVFQSIIRRKTTQYVYNTIHGSVITQLPKNKGCFHCCAPKKIELPFVDYSDSFCESDWVNAGSYKSKSRKELLILIQTLQLQLRNVENRLTDSNKVE